MEELLKQISEKALLIGDYKYSLDQKETKWLGMPPASLEEIHDLEKRLNLKLPEDYKAFLRLNNGFSSPSSVETEFLKTTSVDYWKEIDTESVEIWSDTDDEAFSASIKSSICIADKNAEQQFLLIPPNKYNDNWQYWKFASWIPGEQKYQDLNEYFQSVLEFLEDTLKEQ